MSKEDVEIVCRAHSEFLAGLSRGDPAATFDSGTVAPDFEWIVPAEAAPGLKPVYRGREGWIEFMRTWTEDFDWSIELEQAIDAGDGRVVVRTRQQAIGEGSGVPVRVCLKRSIQHLPHCATSSHWNANGGGVPSIGSIAGSGACF